MAWRSVVDMFCRAAVESDPRARTRALSSGPGASFTDSALRCASLMRCSRGAFRSFLAVVGIRLDLRAQVGVVPHAPCDTRLFVELLRDHDAERSDEDGYLALPRLPPRYFS